MREAGEWIPPRDRDHGYALKSFLRLTCMFGLQLWFTRAVCA